MPIFFFDVRCPMGLEPDETGLEFANAEVAYLKACEAIPDLTAELMRTGNNPCDFAFEIADEAGHVLWHIPFTEPLQ